MKLPVAAPIWVGAVSAALTVLVLARLISASVQPWLLFTLLLVLGGVSVSLFPRWRRYVRSLQEERRHAREISQLHLETIEALAIAIDAKDQTAPNHIRRLQIYATGLGRALGMNPQEVDGVRTAALLHDIGKLAVPEHILVKPGPLTPDEFHKVRSHPEIGARIIGTVPFPYPVASLILGHHERWDGTGYPNGLKGTDIPLGARILSVVDHYDVLTSDRPHHKAIAPDAALLLIRGEAGHALDPQVVEEFVEILPELRTEVQRRNLDVPTRPQPLTGPEEPPATQHLSVFDDIALAHREIYALYQIAQAMGTGLGTKDTMALIAPKLSNLIPSYACALFLYEETDASLRCRFATGVDAPLLQNLAVGFGYGMSGWVAKNRRPLVNARPHSDFEAGGVRIETGLQSALSCPLLLGDRLIGTLNVYHVESGFYNEDHRRLLDRVCEQASAVISNAVVFERTQEDSLTDALTGLPNTRFMRLHLTRELARANRLKSEVALIVMDLDGFKAINDQHGHYAGDCVLYEVANVLRGGTRPYDMCVRYAGDEFIVVVSGCGLDEAEARRVELQCAVDNLVVEVSPEIRLPVTVSAGVAVFPHDGDTYEALLAAADARMYHDKAERKQRKAQIGLDPESRARNSIRA